MVYSKLIFTFNQEVVVDDYIKVELYKAAPTPILTEQRETWVDGARTRSGEVPVAPENGVPGQQSAILFKTFFELDYNTSYYNIYQSLNTVTIEITNPAFYFGEHFVVPNYISVEWINVPGVNYELEGEIIYSQDTDKCGNVLASIETTQPTTSYRYNNVDYPVSSNPFNITIPRGLASNILLSDVDGNNISIITKNFGLLNASNLKVNVDVDVTGGTVTPLVSDADNLDLEYRISAGGDIWSDWISILSPVTGQIKGDYIIEVRDQFDCTISSEYSVTSLGTRKPFLQISKANSINWVLDETIDNYKIFRNELNIFEADRLATHTNCLPMEWLVKDVVPTQIKTNYTDISCKVIGLSSMIETPVLISKKSANINRFESYDCWYYSYGSGKTGVYFVSGNTYDEDEVVGGTFALNGNLPDFAEIGNYITIKGLGTFKIANTVYDNNINKKAIILDNQYIGEPTQDICKSTYNLLPFEVYEFYIDWESIGIGDYFIELHLSDVDNDDIYVYSEKIHIHESLAKNYVHIRYFNKNNRDIFYKYGIENIIRVPVVAINNTSKQESEISLGDNNAIITNSEVYFGKEFIFEELTQSMSNKLILALSSEYVFINGEGYIKDEKIKSDRVGLSNLYDVVANMLKTNENYSIDEGGESGVDIDYIDFDIPQLLDQGNGFIKL